MNYFLQIFIPFTVLIISTGCNNLNQTTHESFPLFTKRDSTVTQVPVETYSGEHLPGTPMYIGDTGFIIKNKIYYKYKFKTPYDLPEGEELYDLYIRGEDKKIYLAYIGPTSRLEEIFGINKVIESLFIDLNQRKGDQVELFFPNGDGTFCEYVGKAYSDKVNDYVKVYLIADFIVHQCEDYYLWIHEDYGIVKMVVSDPLPEGQLCL